MLKVFLHEQKNDGFEKRIFETLNSIVVADGKLWLQPYPKYKPGYLIELSTDINNCINNGMMTYYYSFEII